MTDLRTALQRSAPREVLATWLVCAVADYDNEGGGERFQLDSHSIVDRNTAQARSMEYLFVPPDTHAPDRTAEDQIVRAIHSRIDPAGAGKELVVFIEGLGTAWFATSVAKRLPSLVHFDAVWVITLQSIQRGEHLYGVSHLDLALGHCPVWFITIGKKFDRWTVQQIQ